MTAVPLSDSGTPGERGFSAHGQHKPGRGRMSVRRDGEAVA